MNKTAVVIIIVILVIIGAGYWYFSTINSVPNEQGYLPTTTEGVRDTTNPATAPSGSSQTNTTKPTTQGTGASNSGSKLMPPALPK